MARLSWKDLGLGAVLQRLVSRGSKPTILSLQLLNFLQKLLILYYFLLQSASLHLPLIADHTLVRAVKQLVVGVFLQSAFDGLDPLLLPDAGGSALQLFNMFLLQFELVFEVVDVRLQLLLLHV